MNLGHFGGATSRIKRTAGFAGTETSAGPDLLEETRHRRLPGPEGDLAIREEIASSAVSGQTGAVASTTSTTTNTVSPGDDMDTMTVTFTPVSSNTGVFLFFRATVFNDTNGADVDFLIQKDSVNIEGTSGRSSQATGTNSARQVVSSHHYDAAPTVASHTYKASWWVSAGTGTVTTRRIDAIENRR